MFIRATDWLGFSGSRHWWDRREHAHRRGSYLPERPERRLIVLRNCWPYGDADRPDFFMDAKRCLLADSPL